MTELHVLPESDQLRFAMHPHQEAIFGVHEAPDNFITLKSGRVSPHYMDLRPGVSSLATRTMVATNMLSLANIPVIDAPGEEAETPGEIQTETGVASLS